LADSGLTDLNDALDEMVEPDTASAGATKLRRAAEEIRSLSADADEPLRTTILDTASALDKVATHGVSDKVAMSELTDILERLGQGVQAECHFPIG
jgi:hypothetical protein